MAKKWKAYSWPNRADEDTTSQPLPPQPPSIFSPASSSSSSSASPAPAKSCVLSGRVEKQGKRRQSSALGAKINSAIGDGTRSCPISGASSNTSAAPNNSDSAAAAAATDKNENGRSGSNSANPLNFGPPSDVGGTIIAGPCAGTEQQQQQSAAATTTPTIAGSANCTAVVDAEDDEEIDVVGVGPTATNGKTNSHSLVGPSSSSTTTTTSTTSGAAAASCWGPSSPTVSGI